MEKKMDSIKLVNIKNVRDLGRIAVKEGKIKTHKLLRGSYLENLTQKDVNLLIDEYKLATIIDLRTYREIEESPDVRIPTVRYIHMPIFDKRAPGITHEANNDLGKGTNIDLTGLYKGILSGECLDRVSEIVKTIITLKPNEYSVLFHCTEGKDRTGIISAIILLILGADKQTIIDDYLYTNIANKNKANKYYWKNRIFKLNKSKAENVKNVFLAKQEYIEAFFDVIQNEWNGADNFIKHGLKIKEYEIEDFKDKVLN